MLEREQPLKAIVSIWDSQKTGSDERPLGSGVFVTSQYIQTAKHVIENKNILLGNVTERHAPIPAKKIFPHEELDAALIQLHSPHNTQSWLQLDPQERDLKQCKVSFCGVLPESKESVCFEDIKIITRGNEYGFNYTDGASPKGLSGGAVILNNKIIAIISGRFKNEDIGAIIPVSNIWVWLNSIQPQNVPFFFNTTADKTPPPPLIRIPQDEFADKIKKQVRMLLQSPVGEGFRAKIEQQAGGKEALEVLAPPESDVLIENLNDFFYPASEHYLNEQQFQANSQIPAIKHCMKKILGWLALLVVNRELNYPFDPNQSDLPISTLLEQEAGLEVLLSALINRNAHWKLVQDNKNRTRVVGEDSFDYSEDGLESGIGPKKRTDELQKEIWKQVQKEEAPNDLTAERLKAKLLGNKRREGRYYYITASSQCSQSPSDRALLEELSAQLKGALLVVYKQDQQDDGFLLEKDALLVDENALWDAIEAFLSMLQEF